MLAYDYPLLGLIWTMFILFLWIAWLFLLFRIFADIFRDHEMSGWGKGLWSIFIIFVPFLGTLIYLIARGHSMAERDLKQAQQNEEAFRSYVQNAAASSSTGTADELTKLAGLKQSGVISDAEFEAQKAKLLG